MMMNFEPFGDNFLVIPVIHKIDEKNDASENRSLQNVSSRCCRYGEIVATPKGRNNLANEKIVYIDDSYYEIEIENQVYHIVSEKNILGKFTLKLNLK